MLTAGAESCLQNVTFSCAKTQVLPPRSWGGKFHRKGKKEAAGNRPPGTGREVYGGFGGLLVFSHFHCSFFLLLSQSHFFKDPCFNIRRNKVSDVSTKGGDFFYHF